MKIKGFLSLPAFHKVFPTVFVLTVCTICVIVVIAFRVFKIFNLLHVGSITYTPHTIESFSQIQCDFLLADRLGWNSANSKANTIELEGYIDNPSTTTVNSRWQHAKISRLGNQQLKVGLFVTADQDISDSTLWSITSESEEGLTATETQGSILNLSKKSGLLLFTKLQLNGGPDFISTPKQESNLFSCVQQ